jgi:translation initiation factor IF-2
LINLVVEVEGLKERVDLPKGVLGQSFILESIKDKFRGSIVTLVVTEGEFYLGKWFVYKMGGEIYFEKIKAFLTEENTSMSELKKGFGGRIIGMSNLVELGTEAFCLDEKDENLAKSLFKEDEVKEVNAETTTETEAEDVDQNDLLQNFFGEEQNDEKGKVFKVLIKSSSEGSLEAIKKSIEKIKVDEVEVEIIQSGIGNINISDVEMASVTKSIVLGFEVSFEQGVVDLASKKRVFVKTYDIIYKLIDEVEEAAKALGAPEDLEEEIGSAEVREVFELSDGTQVIGCKGLDGIIRRGGKAYVVRDDEIVGEGKIVSMKHNKKDIKESTKGNEFGVVLGKSVQNVKVGDHLHCFTILK